MLCTAALHCPRSIILHPNFSLTHPNKCFSLFGFHAMHFTPRLGAGSAGPQASCRPLPPPVLPCPQARGTATQSYLNTLISGLRRGVRLRHHCGHFPAVCGRHPSDHHATVLHLLALLSSPAATGELHCTCTVLYCTPCSRVRDLATRALWPHACYTSWPCHPLQLRQVGYPATALYSTALLFVGRNPPLCQGPGLGHQSSVWPRSPPNSPAGTGGFYCTCTVLHCTSVHQNVPFPVAGGACSCWIRTSRRSSILQIAYNCVHFISPRPGNP
jgi:hypothetical protein